LIGPKRNVVLILLSALAYGTAGMALIYYLPRYLLDLGYDLSTIQFVTTLFPFTFIFMPPLLGKISDKIQNRFLFVIIGTVGISFFFILLMFSTNLIFITVILILYGVCGSFSRLIFTLYQELVENSSKFVTYYNAVMVMGWFLGAQFGGIFIDIYGTTQIFSFLVIISLVNILFVSFIRENREMILKYNESSKVDNITEKNSNENDNIEPISKSIYYALFLRHFGVRPIITILAVLISFHLSSDTQIGFLLGINPLLQFFLMLLTGKIITKENQKYIIIIGFFLSSTAIFGYFLATDFYGFLLDQIMISFSFALFWNAIQIYIAQKTNPRNKGKYLGYANSSFFSGGFSGGLFFSLLLLFNPNYYSFIWIMIFFPLISVFVIILKFKAGDQ